MTELNTGPDTLLDAVFDTSPDAIAIFEPDALRPVRSNRAADELPPEIWPVLRDHCRRAARTGVPCMSETLHQAIDGERWLRLNAAPSGALVVATVSDVTAIHEARRTVAETRQEAERQRKETLASGEAKSRFLATMSHELRTPMNAILGFADLLKSYTLDQQQIAYVEIIRRSGQDLLRVLNDILDFSKIDAGFLTLERTPYNPASLARDIVMLFAKTARDRETSLFVSSDPDVPEWIEGDVTRIRQVLSNLIGNACKFTEDGRIDVRVSPGPDGMIEFAVMDSGIGMTSEQLRRIFQPFVQADETTTRRFGGTGLGLAISKRLVEAMGGSVRVTSMPGEGSVFLVRIPATVCQPPAYADEAELDEAATRETRRVLLAEDNAINRMLVERILEQDGHEIVSVPDGRLALMEVAEMGLRSEDNPMGYDLVLMDMHMPEIDGPEATRAIRALGGPASTIPIIGLSADAMSEQMDQHMASGLDGYLTKPLDQAKLRAMVSRTRVHAAPAAQAAVVPFPAPPIDDGPIDHGLIDESQIEEIRDVVGEEMLSELLVAFCRDVRTEFDRVMEACASTDRSVLGAAAHTLRGLAGNLGAARVSELAALLEDAAKSDDIRPVDQDLVAKLSDAVKQTIETLSRRI
jgi:signal transduction histidine kinase/CheY-like chemotaxis protein/HPt (histidine-containing phosphotransfer) domain-containing protein